MTRRPLPNRLYAFLLRLLPFDFQREYGREMEDVFQEQRRTAARAGGPMAAIALWWRTVVGIVSIAPGEHLDALRRDVRFALRSLLRNRVVTAVSILTLGLAIGANTAVFSVVNGVMLRPFPYPDVDRIVLLNEVNERDGSN